MTAKRKTIVHHVYRERPAERRGSGELGEAYEFLSDAIRAINRAGRIIWEYPPYSPAVPDGDNQPRARRELRRLRGETNSPAPDQGSADPKPARGLITQKGARKDKRRTKKGQAKQRRRVV